MAQRGLLTLPKELQDLIFDHVVALDGPFTLTTPRAAISEASKAQDHMYCTLPCRLRKSLLLVSHGVKRSYCEALRRHLVLPSSPIRLEVHDLDFGSAIDLLTSTQASFPCEAQARARRSRVEVLKALTVVLVPVHLRLTICRASVRYLATPAQMNAKWQSCLDLWLKFCADHDVEAHYVYKSSATLGHEEYAKRLECFLKRAQDGLEISATQTVKQMREVTSKASQDIVDHRRKPRLDEPSWVTSNRNCMYVETMGPTGVERAGATNGRRREIL